LDSFANPRQASNDAFSEARRAALRGDVAKM